MKQLWERVKDTVCLPVRYYRYLCIHEPAIEIPLKVIGIVILLGITVFLILLIQNCVIA